MVRRMNRSTRRRIVSSLVVLVATLAVVRGAARAAEPAPDPNGMNRYREDNVRLGPPRADERRVVFMGDSITQGWVEQVPGFFDGRPYVGRGISGQVTRQMRARFQQDVLDLAPAVVVILAGTNDIAANDGPYVPRTTHDNLEAMVAAAKAKGIRVVLAAVLPALDFPWRPGLEPARKIVALNKFLRKLAAREGCVWLDYYGALADAKGALPAEFSADGVHPNVAGYAVMAPLAEKAIADALAAR